jgi:hypothetical protein
MATDKNWCDTCYKKYLADMKRRIGNDKNVFVDLSKISFRCRIPTFTHDLYGKPIVIIHNCETRNDVILSQSDWLHKRNTGEL